MRLSRGANIEGLSAPRPVSEVDGMRFARPLLNISKEQIIEILSKANIAWCEDETNREAVHFRNCIRNRVIPVLEDTVPGFARGVRRSQELLLEDLQVVDKAFESAFNAINSEISDTIKLSDEIVQTRAFLRRAVMKFLTFHSLLDSIRSNAVDTFLNNISLAVREKSYVPIKTSVGNSFIVFSPRTLSLSLGAQADAGDFSIKVGIGSHSLPNGRILRVRKITLGSEKRAEILRGENDDAVRAFLDVSCFGDLKKDALVVRSRHYGDSYAPIGRKLPKKLKELLNAKKVPI